MGLGHYLGPNSNFLPLGPPNELFQLWHNNVHHAFRVYLVIATIIIISSLVVVVEVFVVYRNFHIDGNDFNYVVVGQISDADLSPELKPLPSSNILMVEVDNVQHEQFTVTEEVKVQNTHYNMLHGRGW